MFDVTMEVQVTRLAVSATLFAVFDRLGVAGASKSLERARMARE